jgi:2,4-dienoyl-CoA reductase-like NADH-dependent reductase (Old Yellow Enzyme family)
MTTRPSSIVFSPGHIGGVELKNRLVRSATFENAASQTGEVTDLLLDMYRDLARGGVGLIITGIMGVYPRAIGPQVVRADDDSFVPGLERIPRAVHELGLDCRIMAQLHHPGRQVVDPEDVPSLVQYLPPALLPALQQAQQAEQAAPESQSIVEPTAPSPVFDTLFKKTPRALMLEEIEEIIDAFAEAIRRVEEAGFDGVQLHAAHGWLLSSFLSPHTNRREDQYGGSTANRVRIVTEIYRRARTMVDEGFPILIKMNTPDFLPGGTDLEEAARLAEILSEVGFAALESSGGMWEAVTRSQDELGWTPVILPESRTGIKTGEQEAYFLQGARELKAHIDVPVILVGGLRSFSRIEEILDAGWADFISLSRPLIRQPDLPGRWLSDEEYDRADCVSCNACLPMGPEALVCKTKPRGKAATAADTP